MTGGAARLTLEDFADATGLPLAALEHPLSQTPLTRTPLPCSLCEARAREHASALEQAQQLQSDIVQSLQLSLTAQVEQLRTDMHAQQAKALEAVLCALLPQVSASVLRQKLSAEIAAGLSRPDPIILRVPDGLDVSGVTYVEHCDVRTDKTLSAGTVALEQAGGRTDINCGDIVAACLGHLSGRAIPA